jgi:hypothetical protein
MFNLLLLSFLTVLFHLLVGKNFSKFLNTNKNTYYELSLTSLIGLISLSFIALIINFFVPLNQQTNTIILITLLVSILLTNGNFLKKIISKTVLKFIFFSTLGVFLMIILSNINTPDAGMYHFPYVNILNENKIIIGISNIHHRYGHVSIMQYLSALHFNYVFGINGIVVPLASLAIYSIFVFLSYINQKSDLSISNVFSIFIIIFIFWKMNRYSGYGNDAPAHFIFFIIVLIYLNSLEIFKKIDDKTFYLISLFSIFAFLNKTFLIFALLIPLISINKNILKNIISLKFLLLSLLLISWIVKNILTTGCIIYPMPSTCLNLPWTNFEGISNVYDVSIGSEAWSKDWSNQKDIILPYNEFLENFNWVKFWFKNHFLIILKITVPYILAIGVFSIFLKNMKKNKVILNQQNLFLYFPILTIIFIGIIIWFLKAPIFRYGYSYLISFIALTSALAISYNLSGKKILNQKKISTVIIFLAMIIISTKQFVRIYSNLDSKFENYPWPKFYSQNLDNKKINLNTFKKDGKFLYYVPQKSYCFYSKSPCSSVGVDDNIKLKINTFNYKIYHF